MLRDRGCIWRKWWGAKMPSSQDEISPVSYSLGGSNMEDSFFHPIIAYSGMLRPSRLSTAVSPSSCFSSSSSSVSCTNGTAPKEHYPGVQIECRSAASLPRSVLFSTLSIVIANPSFFHLYVLNHHDDLPDHHPATRSVDCWHRGQGNSGRTGIKQS